jgi:hypothetical protein
VCASESVVARTARAHTITLPSIAACGRRRSRRRRRISWPRPPLRSLENSRSAP